MLGRQGVESMVAEHRRALGRFGIRFDEWSSERALQESGQLQELTETLRASGHAYQQDGALWLRTSAFGDSEDRPILRSNGRHTYIAGDLAYHLDKLLRGFDRVIDIWGPEHAPYAQRTLAGMRALGCDAGALEIPDLPARLPAARRALLRQHVPAGRSAGRGRPGLGALLLP